ncbi:disease resistance protein RPV1-like isoform X2 [Syzygium oleosum]|uniref:disease resistance protein RPV1-like isoform X2 n=1 Tax=Syzygium oleosum TaxID=219896 RepID=UPI0024B8B89F|nr:disease resistance protein RPV1-like isoform X2 [Syzygium oleosum]
MEGSAKERCIRENDGAARGASSSHTSTEGHEMATLSGYDYEVFLSFRGPDTRERFTDFLNTSLKDVGIRTFKDDEDLRKGEEFGPELLQAINQSKISIPIFSKGYASSVWCLKELVQMVECQKTGRQKIMPIFYDVDPLEVRYQTGGYGEAFLSHEKKQRFDEEAMRQRKAALKEVSFLNGWNLHSKTDRREGEFAKTVTQEVFNKLKKAYLEVSDYLVGIDHHVDEIMKKIGARTSETRIIVIHGMGGIGKSTIAKIIYNQLSNNFKHCCFLSNIRELSEHKGIECLRHQLISNILKMKDKKNIDDGNQTIKYRLSTKQVLLLLDDVHEKKHMDALVGERNWFGKGSKLIITTRNKDILKVPTVDDHYEVNGMDPDQSLQLFSKHAFRRDYPLGEYTNQSKRAIGIAGGLPLALEVIGSLLSCTKKEKWDLTLKKLESVPPTEVQSKLNISYGALDVRQKHIFLDIACLFIGYDKDIVIHFWDESKFPEEAMEVLQNMSLIKIKEDNKVWIHDQLRDLGREIVRQESKMKLKKQSRVWNPKEALDLLRRHEGKNKVEALRLKFDHEGQYHFTYKGFIRLSNLRFLAVEGSVENFCAEEMLLWHESPSNVFQENSDLLPQLRWLSWCNIPPTFNITIFSMEDTVILDLSGSEITHDWKGWSHMKVMKNLKVLNLTGCHLLRRTPTFCAPANIERLILHGCKSLIEIDKSICQLKSLVYIDASGCENLCVLPDELGGDLASLEYLNLSRCGLLERLPDSIWKLESLIELNISHTRINELPRSIGKLKNLRVVRICSHISKIPDALWMIEKLEEIEYDRENLPGGRVKVGKCISMNQSLRILRLKLANICTLSRLPESLITLELSRLYMDKFPDLSNLTNLKGLDLMFCPPDLEMISSGPVECLIPQWIEKLSNLEYLRLDSHYVTTSPTDLSLPPHLITVHLECPNLRCLPRLPSSLSFLTLYDCKSLCSMEDLSNLKNLSFLKITFATIAEIQGLGCLGNLRELELNWLGRVKTLPDLRNLNKLRLLKIRSCDDLFEIQGELPLSLEGLRIYSCRSLQKLPDLSSLMGKTNVEIDYCDKFLEYARMNRQVLKLVGFKELQILPNLSNSNELRHLRVKNCGKLVEIQGELPQSLEVLKISSCKLLQKLPDLSNLKKLQRVDIEGCTKLKGEAILGSARRSQANLWENLQYLGICGLVQVEILPDLSNLNKLQHLRVENCDNLVEIQGLKFIVLGN